MLDPPVLTAPRSLSMVDPSSGSDAQLSRRDRRAHRTRHRWRRVASYVAGAALLVGFGLVITETVRFGGDDRPSLAGTVAPSVPTGSALVPSTTIAGRPCRAPLTDADPLRLWVGGDSLAGTLGLALGSTSGETGVVQPYFDSRVSSGLTSRSFFDWPEHAAKEMDRLRPEIAVFIIGANDFAAPLDSAEDEHGQPAWKARYTALVEEMLAVLGSDDRTVIWVGSPSFKDDRNEQIEALDDHMREVVAKHEKVAYVDAYALFTDAAGEYAASLPPLDDQGAEPVLVRAGDGVHLTPQGGARLAQAVFPVIDLQCNVSKQAVPGVVKTAIQTEGSTQVVTGRGGTVQTTPPATAPRATAPPATGPPPTKATTAPTITTAPTPTTTSAPTTTTAPTPTT
jgi:uncharacterized protein